MEKQDNRREITSETARQLMFNTLAVADIGDEIYEFAQNLFQRYVGFIEDNYRIIDKDEYSSGEMWYDEAQDDFYKAVFEAVGEVFAK